MTKSAVLVSGLLSLQRAIARPYLTLLALLYGFKFILIDKFKLALRFILYQAFAIRVIKKAATIAACACFFTAALSFPRLNAPTKA